MSPWVNDLPMVFPNPLRGEQYPPYLSTLLDYLIVERSIKITVYYRDDEKNDLENIKDSTKNQSKIKMVRRITTHSKGVATPELILHGSPNILWRSFNLNEENVAIERNAYSSVQRAVETAFNIK